MAKQGVKGWLLVALLLLLLAGALGFAFKYFGPRSAGNSTYTSPVVDPLTVDEFLSIYSEEERRALTEQGFDHSEVETLMNVDTKMARMLLNHAIQAANFKPLPAGVRTSKPIEWQLLAEWPRSTPIPVRRIFSGNLDAVPGEDILLMGPGNNLLIDPVRKQQSELDPALPLPEVIWDFGADGRDELLREVPDYLSETGIAWMKVYDLSDSIVHSFNCTLCGPIVVPGDFNGDGRTDMGMSALPANGQNAPFEVYDHSGIKILELPAEWNTPNCLAADTDGDGRDEFVVFEVSAYPRAAGIEQEITTLEQFEEHSYFSPCMDADLNGDGCDELISTHAVVVDLANNKKFSLQLPAELSELRLDS